MDSLPLLNRWKRSNLKVLSPVLIFLLGAILAGFCLNFLEESRVDLVVDAQIYAGDQMEVYLNENWQSPLYLTLHSGERKSYVFSSIPVRRIESIRIDPTASPGARVLLYGLEVRNSKGSIAKFDAKALRNWTIHGGGLDQGENSSALALKSEDDLQLLAKVDLVFGNWAPPFTLKEFVNKGILGLVCLLFGGILLASRQFLALVALLSSYVAARRILSVARGWSGPIPTVANAVGSFSFFGFSKDREYLAFWAAIVAAIFALLLVFALGKWFKRLPALCDELPDTFVPSSKFFAACVAASFAFFDFPDLSSIFGTFDWRRHIVSYDAQNFVTWQYLLSLGKVPFTDFWYPYSGFFYTGFGSAYPSAISHLLYYLHILITCGVFAWCMYHFLGYRKLWTLFGLFAVMFLQTIRVLDRIDRYFLSLDFFLLLAYVLETRVVVGCVSLALFGGYVFYMEPVQLVYAGVPSILLFSFAVLRSSQRVRKEIISKIGGAAFGCLLIVGAILWCYALNGSLKQFFKFYLTMGDSAPYGMFLAPVYDWISLTFSEENWLLLFTLGLTCSSLWFCLSLPRKSLKISDLLPLLISLISIFVFQKQMIRPHIGTQLIGVPLVGVLLLAHRYYVRTGMSLASRNWIALISGALLMALYIGDRTAYGQSIVQRSLQKIGQVSSDFGLAYGSEQAWKAQEQKYFSPSSFQFRDGTGDQLVTQIVEKLSIKEKDSIFVLGDDPFVYIVLRKAIPFYLTLYNESLLYSQEDTVRWLKEVAPKYVFYRKDRQGFDGVPNVVRVPLVFSAIVSNYRYETTIGEFSVLKLKGTEAPVDWNFWIETLSSEIDLGFVPSRAEPYRYKGTGMGSTVRNYLIAESDHPKSGDIRRVFCSIGEHKFSVRFNEAANKEKYFISLERLWFYSAALAHGLKPECVLSDFGSFRVKIEQVPLAKDILY